MAFDLSRTVFGKALIEQPVIRHKFAHMFAKIEALQAYLEHISEWRGFGTSQDKPAHHHAPRVCSLPNVRHDLRPAS